MLEARPAESRAFLNERLDRGATFRPEQAVRVERKRGRCIANDQTAETAIADEDVGAKPQNEMRDMVLARDDECSRQLVGVAGFIEEVGRPTNLECGERRELYIATDATGAELFVEHLVDGSEL